MNEAIESVDGANAPVKFAEKEIARFWSNVDKLGGSEACWPWMRSKSNKGYGYAGMGGKVRKAHRVAWMITNGPIPKGEGWNGTCVCHSCDNPSCCNPAHLWIGTNADNTRDRDIKGRHWSRTKPGSASRGEKQGSSKLTDSAVREIRAIYAAGGISQKAIGLRFGVCEMAINRIIHGKAWVHVQ